MNTAIALNKTLETLSVTDVKIENPAKVSIKFKSCILNPLVFI